MTKLRTTTCPAPLPVLRAAVFALVGTVLGVSAHHLVAEGPMPWRRSAPAAAVLFGVGLVGTRRPRPFAAVVAVCGAAQAGVHVWLMAEHSDGSAPMAMPAHMHHGMDTPTAWHDQMRGSLAMTAVHAVAAVLVAVLLHRADAVCWSLARPDDRRRRGVGTRRHRVDAAQRAPDAAGDGAWGARAPLDGTATPPRVVARGRGGKARPSPGGVHPRQLILPGRLFSRPAHPHAWRHPCSVPGAGTTPPAA